MISVIVPTCDENETVTVSTAQNGFGDYGHELSWRTITAPLLSKFGGMKRENLAGW